MTEVFEVRPFKETPYLVTPDFKPFKIRLGNLLPSLSAFVYQKGELFGDPLPLNLAGLFIKFNLYNKDNMLISQGNVNIIDLDRSQIEYQWQQFDFREPGQYFGEFVFEEINDKIFTLTGISNRIEIIVY